jgi:hypothetical protein
MTHDIIGKPLEGFYRQTKGEGFSELPKVFETIHSYFLEDKTRLANRHLFAKLDDNQMKQVDVLEQHVAFGDYHYIKSIEDPSIVGTYLKCVLKYMEQPLCQFPKYELFKLICAEIPYSKSPHEKLVKSIA